MSYLGYFIHWAIYAGLHSFTFILILFFVSVFIIPLELLSWLSDVVKRNSHRRARTLLSFIIKTDLKFGVSETFLQDSDFSGLINRLPSCGVSGVH